MAPSSALTQQNLCHFVALATIKRNSRQALPPTFQDVPCPPEVGQQNYGFVSFGLLPSFLCHSKTIVHYKPRFVNW